jgi:hypothetical protein
MGRELVCGATAAFGAADPYPAAHGWVAALPLIACMGASAERVDRAAGRGAVVALVGALCDAVVSLSSAPPTAASAGEHAAAAAAVAMQVVAPLALLSARGGPCGEALSRRTDLAVALLPLIARAARSDALADEDACDLKGAFALLALIHQLPPYASSGVMSDELPSGSAGLVGRREAQLASALAAADASFLDATAAAVLRKHAAAPEGSMRARLALEAAEFLSTFSAGSHAFAAWALRSPALQRELLRVLHGGGGGGDEPGESRPTDLHLAAAATLINIIFDPAEVRQRGYEARGLWGGGLEGGSPPP